MRSPPTQLRKSPRVNAPHRISGRARAGSPPGGPVPLPPHPAPPIGVVRRISFFPLGAAATSGQPANRSTRSRSWLPAGSQSETTVVPYGPRARHRHRRSLPAFTAAPGPGRWRRAARGWREGDGDRERGSTTRPVLTTCDGVRSPSPACGGEARFRKIPVLRSTQDSCASRRACPDSRGIPVPNHWRAGR